MESRYKLTRGDPNYSIDLSEGQYPAYSGNWGGGDPTWMMSYAVNNPIVQVSELPFYAYGSNPAPGTWPLQPGWQNRGVLPANYLGAGGSVAALKTALLTYGPGVLGVNADNCFYWPGSNSPVPSGISTVPEPGSLALVAVAAAWAASACGSNAITHPADFPARCRARTGDHLPARHEYSA